jgi:S1-C subfamily serine protease
MKRIAVIFLIIIFIPLHYNAFALTPEERSNIKVFKEASPSVVNITTTTLVKDYFSVHPREGAGSGTIIKKEGYVLTNYHVVQGANEIHVTLSNGERYQADFVGIAPEDDLAILKIRSDAAFKPLKMGNSEDLMVGQKVFAIGNPFGLNSTLTTGIISAVGRPLTTESGMVIENVIQTDTPINPGNSGGPLIDSDGKIIGMNTAIFTPSGGSVGIGFAIPINAAKNIIPDLIKYGKVRRPWLGVTGVPLWEELSDELGLEIKKGILVSQVVEGGPADKAGLKGGKDPIHISKSIFYTGGDIITEIDGMKVGSMRAIRSALADKKEGQVINVKIYRKGGYITLKMSVKLKT